MGFYGWDPPDDGEEEMVGDDFKEPDDSEPDYDFGISHRTWHQQNLDKLYE